MFGFDLSMLDTFKIETEVYDSAPVQQHSKVDLERYK